MTNKRQQEIEQVFHQACQLPTDKQAAFVAQVLANDETAKQEVMLLLDADKQDSLLLNRILHSPSTVSREVSQLLQPNARVGAYLIEKEISRGGMGQVFLGTRNDEAYESQVAIKLVRIEKNSEWAEKRFLEERQILAKLNHPNIATLLDGGTTEDGQPYVVMQYINGLSITDYCHQHKLKVSTKLELFIKVVEAVSHAHKNLVIHRDIKPSNILVTKEGEPKLLDFGIAKIINEELNAGDVTQMGMMTPAYASPEQVRGELISTASDIYSLGVLLYELLAGEPPFDMGAGSPAEIVKAVCDTEPVPPSTKASEPNLSKTLQGDLDNIILKAMQKDPAKRYDTANELIDDIQNHLSGFPVLAVSDSSWYKSRKFIQRHWLSLSAAAAFVLMVSSLTFYYTLQLTTERDRAIQAENIANAAKAAAQRESQTANRVSEFLTRMFAVNDPNAGIGGKQMTARELLDVGSNSITESLNEEPETKAHLLQTIGLAYFNLGEQSLGIEHLRQSLAIHRSHSEKTVVAESMNRLANLLRQADEYDEAVKLYQESLALHESYSADATWELADAYNNFGLLIYHLGQYEEAKHYLNKAISTHRAAAGGNHKSVGINLHNLSLILRVMAEFNLAEEMIKESLDITAKYRGADSSNWAISLQQLGRIENDLGRYNQALSTLNLALDKYLVHFEPGNNRMGALWGRMANSHQALGHFQQAENYYQRAIKNFSDTQGPDSSLVVYTEAEYGSLLRQMKRLDVAEQVLRHSLKVNQDLFIPTHPNTANTAAELALVLAEQNQLTEAEILVENAIVGLSHHFHDDHPDLAWARLVKAKIYFLNERHELAEKLFNQAINIFNERRNHYPVKYAHALYEQVLMAQSKDQCDQVSLLKKSAQTTLNSLNEQHPLLADWAAVHSCE